MTNGDTEDIFAFAKEQAKHLTKYQLPKLNEWRETFLASMVIIEESIDELRPSGDGNEGTAEMQTSAVQLNTTLSSIKRVLKEVEKLITSIEVLVNSRCKEFLQ